MSDAGARHGKNRNIQFLRGLAIVLVLLAHGSVMLIDAEAVWWDGALQRFLPGVGVDLFFLISGFLMGATFLRKHRQFDAAAVYGFYKKRIRRVLLPTVLVCGGIAVRRARAATRRTQLFAGHPAGRDGERGVLSRQCVQRAARDGFRLLLVDRPGSTVLPAFPLLLLLGRAFWPAVIGIVLWFSFANPFAPEWLFRANGLFLGLLLWKLSSPNRFGWSNGTSRRCRL